MTTSITQDVKPEPPRQLVLPKKSITHHPKAGINPLVDAAAYLFSTLGKLKKFKSYSKLSDLQTELVQGITAFQDTAKERGYSPEYILVSRYAICATFDDIIANTSWGSQGQWENHSLLGAFSQEPMHLDRFFVILERITKDPALYIDLMEFMYICLSLGFKGNYRQTEYSNNQLEQITHSLYKHIRAYQGDFTKTLSPFPAKITPHIKSAGSNAPIWLTTLLTTSLILLLYIGKSVLYGT